MKKYFAPEVNFTKITLNDILSGSDVLIDGSGLFEEQE